jgi:hypothetical protein
MQFLSRTFAQTFAAASEYRFCQTKSLGQRTGSENEFWPKCTKARFFVPVFFSPDYSYLSFHPVPIRLFFGLMPQTSLTETNSIA